jgi:hypothetical protein
MCAFGRKLDACNSSLNFGVRRVSVIFITAPCCKLIMLHLNEICVIDMFANKKREKMKWM